MSIQKEVALRVLAEMVDDIQSGKVELQSLIWSWGVHEIQGPFGVVDHYYTGHQTLLIDYKRHDMEPPVPGRPTLAGPTGIQEAEIVEDPDALQ